MPREAQMDWASGRFEVPLKIFTSVQFANMNPQGFEDWIVGIAASKEAGI
jgi:hypothetical protein